MLLPRWLVASAWAAFALAALLPLLWLGLDALSGEGRLSALRDPLLTEAQWRLLARSLVVAGGAALLALGLGVPYALAIERTTMPGRHAFQLLGLVPLLIPPQLHAIVWSRLLASSPVDPFSIPGVVLVLGLAYFPFVVLLTSAGLRAIDPTMEDGARLRVGPPRGLVGVTLALVRPHMLAAALLVFVFAIVDFGVPDLLRVRVYAVEVFIEFSALYDQRGAVFLSAPLLLTTMALVGIMTWLMRGRAYVSLSHGAGDAGRFRWGGPRIPAVLFCGSVLGLSVLVPVASLAVSAGAALFDPGVLRPALSAIGTSVSLAVSAGALTTMVAFVIARGLMQTSEVFRGALHALTQLPFALPPILLGIGLIGLWNREATGWFYDGLGVVLVGYLARFLPFAIGAMLASLQQLNPRLEEAAWLVTANRLRILGGLSLPLLRDGLAAAFIIVFILTMGELGVTLLVVPPGVETLPVRIYNLMHYGADASVAALSLILIAIQLLVCSLVLVGVRRRRPSVAS